jgi:hypothetical protein
MGYGQGVKSPIGKSYPAKNQPRHGAFILDKFQNPRINRNGGDANRTNIYSPSF